MSSPKKMVSSLEGSDRTNLLNTNAKLAMENMGYGDIFPHLQQVSESTDGRVQPYEIFETIHRESKFDRNAKSKISSAAGWGQFTKDTRDRVKLQNPYDPVQSVYAIGRYLDEFKRGGVLDPVETQKAYMLGGGGYNNMKRGSTKVAGLRDIPQLVDIFNKDIESLASGNVSSKAWTGKDMPDKRQILAGEMSGGAPALSGALSQLSPPRSYTSDDSGGALSQRSQTLQNLLASSQENVDTSEPQYDEPQSWYKQKIAELFS